MVLVKIVEANQLFQSQSILWQVPQYLTMTIVEILLSSVGLEFAYTQTPASMRPVLQTAWLFTIAIGNLIVVVITDLHIFKKQS